MPKDAMTNNVSFCVKYQIKNKQTNIPNHHTNFRDHLINQLLLIPIYEEKKIVEYKLYFISIY